MAEWQRLTTAAQIAAHLRDELERGRWRGKMPGVICLARELGVSRNSVEAALHELEMKGLLSAQGAGRGRLIDLEGARRGAQNLRVAVLLNEPADRKLDYIVELIRELQGAGHSANFAFKTLQELGGGMWGGSPGWWIRPQPMSG